LHGIKKSAVGSGFEVKFDIASETWRTDPRIGYGYDSSRRREHGTRAQDSEAER
jgi:hypothetical protein